MSLPVHAQPSLEATILLELSQKGAHDELHGCRLY